MAKNCPLSFHAEPTSVSKEKTLTGGTIVSSELEAMNGHDHGLGADTSKDKDIYRGRCCDRSQESGSALLCRRAAEYGPKRRSLDVTGTCCRGAATFLVSLVSVGTDTAALAAQKETFEAGGVNLP